MAAYEKQTTAVLVDVLCSWNGNTSPSALFVISLKKKKILMVLVLQDTETWKRKYRLSVSTDKLFTNECLSSVSIQPSYP